MGRTLIALLTLLSFTSCTTLQPLADVQPATIQASVKPGDTVVIETNDGFKHEMKIVDVTGDALVGPHGRRVPLSSIKSIGMKVMTTQDKWYTAGIVAAVVGGVVLALSGDDDSYGGGGGGGSGGY